MHSGLAGSRRMGRLWVSFGLALVLLLSACGGSASGPSVKGTQTATASAQQVVTVQFTAEDGVLLDGTLYGGGSAAIILSNEGDNASDPWRPVARRFAAAGYLVLSYAYRPTDANFDELAAHSLLDLRGAIAFLRARSVTSLVLVGASLGALESLKIAASVPCDALVSISAPVGYQDVVVSDADLQQLVMPKLFVTSADNQPFSGDTQRMFATAPEPKEVQIYPGSAHGTSLFVESQSSDLVTVLLEFIQRTVAIG